MAGLNKVILIGRLGKDPEVKTLENGSVVANFSLATSEVYKDKTSGERKEITEWHNIVVWRNLADICGKYLSKGDMINIEGKIRTRTWEKDGQKRQTTEIVADTMLMLITSKKGAAAPAPAEKVTDSNPGEGTDDLPF